MARVSATFRPAEQDELTNQAHTHMCVLYFCLWNDRRTSFEGENPTMFCGRLRGSQNLTFRLRYDADGLAILVKDL